MREFLLIKNNNYKNYKIFSFSATASSFPNHSLKAFVCNDYNFEIYHELSRNDIDAMDIVKRWHDSMAIIGYSNGRIM